jgi:hypothetical protein
MRRPYLAVMSATLVTATALVALYLAMMGTAAPASANTLCTSSYGGSVQAAISAAGDGDTVQVVYGTYYENLNIAADITVEGGYSKGCTDRWSLDPADTVINGSAAGSVVSITGGSTAILDGLTLTNGHAQKGGGVYVSGASPTLDNVVVTGNVISPTGTTTGDSTQWAYGGGVFVEDGAVTLTDCEITYNTSDPSAANICFGGGLALDWVPAAAPSAVLEGTSVTNNSNPSDTTLYGGGLFLDAGSEVTFEGTDNLIAYNDAKAGGGVYMYGNVDLEGVLILDNYASINGGGIHLGSGYNGGLIANNYLVENNAGQKGPSIAAIDVSVEIANNTIVGDKTSSGAGIDLIDAATGSLELTNNIVVSHTIGIRRNDSASASLSHNDVWGNSTNYVGVSAGSGDVSADPQFVDPGNGDYHLASGSPCVNAGTYVEGLLFDYEGDRRTVPVLDIGADEYPMEPIFIPLAVKGSSP